MADIVTSAEVFAYLGISTPTSQQNILMSLIKPMAEDAMRQFVGFTITSGTYTHLLPELPTGGDEVRGLDSVNDRVFVEYADGTNRLYLPERPVRSVVNLYEDQSAYAGQGQNDFSAGTLLTQGTDYYVSWMNAGVSWSGLVLKIAGSWSSRMQSIKVEYTAGLTANELSGATAVRGPNGQGVGSLKMAALLSAAIAFKQTQTVEGSNMGPIQSERLADYSVSYGKSAEQLFGMKYDLPEQVKAILGPYRRYTV